MTESYLAAKLSETAVDATLSDTAGWGKKHDPGSKCSAAPPRSRACAHMHIHTHASTYVHTYTCIRIHVHTYTCVGCAHMHIHTCMCAHDACVYVYVHTLVRMNTYTHVRMRTHTCTLNEILRKPKMRNIFQNNWPVLFAGVKVMEMKERLRS